MKIFIFFFFVLLIGESRITKKGRNNLKIAIPVAVCSLMYISMKGGKNMNFSMVIENTLAAFQAQNPHISERAATARP